MLIVGEEPLVSLWGGVFPLFILCMHHCIFFFCIFWSLVALKKFCSLEIIRIVSYLNLNNTLQHVRVIFTKWKLYTNLFFFMVLHKERSINKLFKLFDTLHIKKGSINKRFLSFDPFDLLVLMNLQIQKDLLKKLFSYT